MTERRMTPDPGAEHDAIVSDAYRDIATERAPQHLDRAVLDTAEKQARPGYLRWRTWTRPIAWAAVVMLSVAILIETNRAPLEVAAPAVSEATPAAGVAERKAEPQLMKSDLGAAEEQLATDTTELRGTDRDLIERAEEMARMQQGRLQQPDIQPVCDESARAEPESWLECIVELEAAGFVDVAREERDLLNAAFPGVDAR